MHEIELFEITMKPTATDYAIIPSASLGLSTLLIPGTTSFVLLSCFNTDVCYRLTTISQHLVDTRTVRIGWLVGEHQFRFSFWVHALRSGLLLVYVPSRLTGLQGLWLCLPLALGFLLEQYHWQFYSWTLSTCT